MNVRYTVRPKADEDLDEQAFYYAARAGSELAHRFLVAAHETFSLLAAQPLMGWKSKIESPSLKSLRIFRVAGFEKMLILYISLADRKGVEVVRVIHGARNLQSLFHRFA